MKLTLEELDKLKCLWKVNLELQVQQGFIGTNPFKDSDCKNCNNYHSGILCYHYINLEHLNNYQSKYGIG